MTLAIGLYASGWPEHIRNHPWLVGFMLFAGISLSLYGWLSKPTPLAAEAGDTTEGQKITTGRDYNSSAPSNSGVQVKDSSGSPLVAGRDIILPLFHPQPIPPAIAKKEPPKIPDLEFSIVANRTVVVNDYQLDWGGVTDNPSLVIAVLNRPGDHGEFAHDANAIVARITLGEITIERACWIGKDQNQIKLEGGDTAYALVGIPDNKDVWTLLNNPNQDKFYYGDFGGGFRGELETHSLFLPKESQVAGEIIIVSKEHATKGLTFAKKKFVLTESSTSGLFPVIARWR